MSEFVCDRLQASRIAAELLDEVEDRRPEIRRMLDGSRGEELPRVVLAVAADMASKEPQRRADAAAALGVAAGLSRKHCGGEVVDEIAACVPSLISLLRDQPDIVRREATIALGFFCPCIRRDVVRALIDGPLTDPVPAVVIAALQALGRCDRGTASAATGRLVELLAHEDEGIRRAICGVLSWLGEEAVAAVKSLFECAASDSCHEIQIAAARALASIDPSDRLIRRCLRDIDTAAQIANLLADSAGSSCKLRNALQSIAASRETAPPPGYRRMRMREMIIYIFGRDEINDKQTAHRLHDRHDQAIRNAMDHGQLDAIGISRGLYDVHVEDLRTFRDTHGHEQPTEQPAV